TMAGVIERKLGLNSCTPRWHPERYGIGRRPVGSNICHARRAGHGVAIDFFRGENCISVSIWDAAVYSSGCHVGERRVAAVYVEGSHPVIIGGAWGDSAVDGCRHLRPDAVERQPRPELSHPALKVEAIVIGAPGGPAKINLPIRHRCDA